MEQPATRPARRISFGEQLKAAKKALQQKPEAPKKQTDTAEAQRKAERQLLRAQISEARELEKRQKARDKAQQAAQKAALVRSRVAADKINTGHVKRRAGERVFKINPNGPDLTGKVLTQINHNTWGYVSPDADAEAFKQKIENRHLNDSKDDHFKAKSDLSY